MEEQIVPNVLRAFVTQEIKAINAESKEILHLITTASVDRAGAVVEPAGAEMANFMRNPVVTANHDHEIQSIIGRAVDISISEKGISARTRFRDTPLGRDAFQLAAEGLGGWSVVFRPMKYEPIKAEKGISGHRFKQWELLAYGLVVIPCNQDIVQSAIGRGLVAKEHVPVFFSVPQDPEPSAEPEAVPEPNAEDRIVREVNPKAARVLARVRRTFACSRIDSDIQSALEVMRNG